LDMLPMPSTHRVRIYRFIYLLWLRPKYVQ
jgi:hypothetical protein